LNPALIYRGDVAVENIVTAIHESPVWREGHNVIIVVWDENDYSISPTTNKVLLTVETNYGVKISTRTSLSSSPSKQVSGCLA
jgi:hypothetical protein